MNPNKTISIIANFLRLTLIVAIVTAAIYNSWSNLTISTLALILTFLPTWFEKKYKIYIPLDFELVIILFIYASLFLGEVHNFYTYFWWWDIFLHLISALAFACIGFIILFILFQSEKIKAHPIWIAIFSFCFAIAIGSLWEIYEFSMDQFFTFNMQKTGLMDTMWDLITDSIGAFISSLAGFFYMKGNKHSYFYRLVSLFIKDNPGLIKQKRSRK